MNTHSRTSGRLIALAILALLVSILLSGSMALAADRTFMWKVESRTATAYLLGSLHMMKPEMYPLDQRIEQAFRKSETLVVEVDVSSSENAGIQQAFMREATYGSNDMLLNHISKPTFELLQNKFREYGVPVENLLSFKPWALGITLQVLALQKLGYNPEYGIDLHFLKKAKGTKQTVELESADFQMRMLRSLGEIDQELFIIDTVKNIDITRTLMQDLIASWQRGDEKALEAIIFKSLNDEPRLSSFYEKLLFDRNRTMADKIDTMLRKKGTYFVVIGAGHLVGDRGVARLLERKGLLVQQQ